MEGKRITKGRHGNSGRAGEGKGGRVVGREEATRVREERTRREGGEKMSNGKEGGKCGVRLSVYPTV